VGARGRGGFWRLSPHGTWNLVRESCPVKGHGCWALLLAVRHTHFFKAVAPCCLFAPCHSTGAPCDRKVSFINYAGNIFLCLLNPLKTKVPVFCHPVLSDFRKSIAFRKVPRLYPFVLQVRATCRWRWVGSICRMILTGENRSARRKPRPNATFIRHKCYMDWPGLEPGPARWETGD
jgi:hypothetical protein